MAVAHLAANEVRMRKNARTDDEECGAHVVTPEDGEDRRRPPGVGSVVECEGYRPRRWSGATQTGVAEIQYRACTRKLGQGRSAAGGRGRAAHPVGGVPLAQE